MSQNSSSTERNGTLTRPQAPPGTGEQCDGGGRVAGAGGDPGAGGECAPVSAPSVRNEGEPTPLAVVVAGTGGVLEAPPSLSMCHNCDKEPGKGKEREESFKMSGTQGRTAFALRYNIQQMIKEGGLDCVGFLTLTVGDKGPDGRFRQVKDADEASRRIHNLQRRVLSDLFEKAVIVTERHQSGAIHFHVVGTLHGRPDIRTGVDHESLKRRDYRSAPESLRMLWEHLREVLPGYGFGRAELLPIRLNGEAVAAYVSKYIEKNLKSRRAEDKGRKLVRYLGWDKCQLKANEFGWNTPRARAWRGKARSTAGVIKCETPEECAEALGPRWAFLLTTVFCRLHGDNLLPDVPWTCLTRMAAFETLRRFTKGWKKPFEGRSYSGEGISDDVDFDHEEWGRRQAAKGVGM